MLARQSFRALEREHSHEERDQADHEVQKGVGGKTGC